MLVLPKHFAKLFKYSCCVFLLAVSIFITSCGLGEKLFPTVTPDQVEEVKNICNNINLPPSFVKVKEINTVKSNLASRSTQYNSTDSTEVVEKFFTDQLTKSGWKHKRERNGNSISLLFKKDKYSILMEIESSDIFNRKNKLHFISCSIGVW